MRITTKPGASVGEGTVDSFAGEWSRYDQSELSEEEIESMFENYFRPPEGQPFV